MTTKIAAALTFVLLNGYVYWFMGSAEYVPPRTEFAQFPDDLDGWRCAGRETIDDKTLENLRVSDYVSCNYYRPDERLQTHLYIGYHERQTRDERSGKATAIHPPEHCLPGSGWDVIDSRIVPVDVGGGGEAKRFVIAKGHQRALVYFWYHSRGRVIARSHEKILWMFLDRARTGRTDGSLVRFTVPIVLGDEEKAEETFQNFASAVTPLLPDYIPN